MSRNGTGKFGVVSLLAVGLILGVATATVLSQGDVSESQRRERAQKLRNDGNFKDAYEDFRQLCLDPATDARQVGNDLAAALECLQRLGRVNETDELLEKTIEVHAENWRLLFAAARQYAALPHQGYMIAGEFQRGPHRGGGKLVNSLERDRVRSLQLMSEALPLTREEDDKPAVSDFYLGLSDLLLSNRGYQEAWRLQYLTDLDTLPDYDDGYPFFRPFNGAPVDEEGNPVFFATVGRWQDAQTDGQRWRWALDQAVEHAPSRLNQVRWQRAQFAHMLYGVQTMAQAVPWGRNFFGLPVTDDSRKDESGTYELHTLGDGETIAKLATGVKRFDLPDDYNFIKLFRQIADEGRSALGEQSLDQLASLFENRRQYPQAAEYWERSIREYGPGNNEQKRRRLEQIVGNWGAFETVGMQPSGTGASVEFRFRNGKRVDFEAHRIDTEKLLADVKQYLKSDPGRLDWNKLNVDRIGWRIVHQNEKQYVGERVAAWDLELDPRENHWDRRITVTTPLQKPGAYLVTGRMRDGNVSKIVLWVADTALVRKQLSEKNLYFVADAVSGEPVAGANVEFFGYKQERVGNRRYRIVTTNFAETSDAQGQVIPDPRDLDPQYTWLVTARGPRNNSERFAYLGFSGVWSGRYYDQEYNQVKIFNITDRPVYRPGQDVKFKFWVRRAQYDKDDTSQFAERSFPVEIYGPKGDKLFSQTLTSDEFGGVEGTFPVPADATLGVYRFQLQVDEQGRTVARGGTTFRVEEYKKPEFEVSIDAPDKPVMLGEKIQTRIKADYYFGSPVVNATVKYKVLRQDYSERWFPVAPWDWCYGPGYWWFSEDYPWYPGWSEWVGCRRPLPIWWPVHRDPPEVVMENEVPIGPDGTVQIEIDTALAKAVHGDTDHEYTIEAEVRDESRRTIVGEGKVLVARKPFQVYTWVDRGYYRVGDTITANFLAQTLDRRPVEGTGKLTLYKITYDEQLQPVETAVSEWQLDTDSEGRAEQQLRASRKGQYRLSYEVTDQAGHTIEGGYLFTIIGEGFDGSEYRFNPIELIPDRREYRPGDKVQLQINTNRVGSTVLLFIRPTNGVYLPPRVIRMQGKSVVEEIGVVRRDMPNFFVEAVTIAEGRVHSETREIVVPPEKRVLNLTVTPSAKEFKPGEQARVDLHLTDHTGENFVGSTVVAIYDKALEYISGGSNVPDIKEFFWKWRRHHQPQHETNLSRRFSNLTLPGKYGMSFLGVFGATVDDDLSSIQGQQLEDAGPSQMRARFGGGPGAPMEGVALAADAAAAPTDRFAAGGVMTKGEAASGIGGGGGAGAGGATEFVEPAVRTNFADTALWVGSITTDPTGRAEVSLKMPENLTSWKIKAWSMGHGTRVGSAEADVVTRKNLLVRLQAPRFFIERDEVVLSANVHNYLDREKLVSVRLEMPGEELLAIDDPQTQITIPAGGEQRVDWRVKVVSEGQATVRMLALTDEESDAMEMKLPCYVHGMLKTESWAGTVQPDESAARVTINVPAERRPEQSKLQVRYSPSLAMAMVDALPYLADYPYGCTEQTLNRFLPTVITQRMLQRMDVNLEQIRDKRTNLNAQELGDPEKRAAQWQRFDRNPVFDPEEVERMVKEGVKRLTNMQNADGGWGWFSGWQERSWPHTTAVVVHGLQLARENDVALVPGVLENGLNWLERYQQEQLQRLRNADGKKQPWKSHADNLDAFVYMVLVDAGKDNAEMRDALYRDRIHLAVYAKGMFGLALHKQGRQEELDMIVRNIEQFLVVDRENDTAFLRLPADNLWWHWYGSETEANAYYLKLLARVGDERRTGPKLVKYLLNNRKHATYWSNTRDTAVCVEAFADYLRATGEMKPDMVVEVWVDGEKRQEVAINEDNLFTYQADFVLAGEQLTDGSHDIEIRRRGKGPVYFNAYLTNFTLEDMIARAGLEVRVRRDYYRLIPTEKRIKVEGSRGQPVGQKVEHYTREPLSHLDTLQSGDLVEIELVIESKNDYEYMIFEDMKASGFEPVELRSGYTSNGLGAYMELRDNRVAFFVRRLARGKHSIAYRMRAEIPGRFSALPAHAYGMYAPELQGNSDEIKLKIEDELEE